MRLVVDNDVIPMTWVEIMKADAATLRRRLEQTIGSFEASMIRAELARRVGCATGPTIEV